MNYSINTISFVVSICILRGIEKISYKNLFAIKSKIETNMNGVLSIEIDRESIFIASVNNYFDMGKRSVKINREFINKIRQDTFNDDEIYSDLPVNIKDRYIQEIKNVEFQF